ncbi:hypothetical protein [Gaiella occulta]|uniref:hypothetical protein n=1 Tax=Gaiella occulta TaxID=1002870 RepID=UPI001C68AC75|nr:hypothetical protein [Gaiella occulta]
MVDERKRARTGAEDEDLTVEELSPAVVVARAAIEIRGIQGILHCLGNTRLALSNSEDQLSVKGDQESPVGVSA